MNELMRARGIIEACLNHGLVIKNAGSPTSSKAVERVLYYLSEYGDGCKIPLELVTDHDYRVRLLYYDYCFQYKTQAMLADSHAAVRMKYYKHNGTIGDYQGKPVLWHKLRDPSVAIRRHAIKNATEEQCRDIGDYEQSKDPNKYIRHCFYMKHEHDPKILKQALQESDVAIRMWALYKLQWQGHPWWKDKSWKIRFLGMCEADCPRISSKTVAALFHLLLFPMTPFIITEKPGANQLASFGYFDETSHERKRSYIQKLATSDLKRAIILTQTSEHRFHHLHALLVRELKDRAGAPSISAMIKRRIKDVISSNEK